MKWQSSETPMTLLLLEATVYKQGLDFKWQNFCQYWPTQYGQEQTIIEVDNQVPINKINYFVNDFPYHSDKEDYWTCNASGDCEDKALEKRRLLHEELEIPMGAMSLIIVKNRNGITHAVLCLHTTEGDYILDNENAFIVPWDKTNFREYYFININNDWYNIE